MKEKINILDLLYFYFINYYQNFYIIKNNYPLGKFKLKGLPHKKKEDVHLDVTFELDEDSILTVTAVDRDNKSNSNSIVISLI